MLPVGLTERWNVDCRNVGSGLPALKYLARYLYRGGVSERQLVRLDWTRRTATFRYTESATGKTVLRTLSIAAFLWHIARHVLPRGFRRMREYGFWHHNAAKTRKLVQLILHVGIEIPPGRSHPAYLCPCCQQPMQCVGVHTQAVLEQSRPRRGAAVTVPFGRSHSSACRMAGDKEGHAAMHNPIKTMATRGGSGPRPPAKTAAAEDCHQFPVLILVFAL